MEDLEILEQLYKGLHLSHSEIIRATELIYMLKQELNSRM